MKRRFKIGVWAATIVLASGTLGAIESGTGVAGRLVWGLVRPAWAQDAQAVIAPVQKAVEVAAQAAQDAAATATSANALAQQQAALTGGLACVLTGGTISVGDVCAFRTPDGSVRLVPLKDANGLLAAMAVRR